MNLREKNLPGHRPITDEVEHTVTKHFPPPIRNWLWIRGWDVVALLRVFVKE
jgi:hypothetical protein